MSRVLSKEIRDILENTEIKLKDNRKVLPTLLHYFMMGDGITANWKRDEDMKTFVDALRKTKLEVREYIEGCYVNEVNETNDENLLFNKCDIYLIKNILEDGYNVRVEISYI